MRIKGEALCIRHRMKPVAFDLGLDGVVTGCAEALKVVRIAEQVANPTVRNPVIYNGR